MVLEDFRMDCTDRSGQVSILSTEQGYNRIESLQGTIEKPVMSVELAMKRELTYRRKMEMLQLQLRGDSNKPPMPSQGPLLSLCPGGIKRKAPTSNLQWLPPPQPVMLYSHQPFQNKSVNIICKVCQVACSSGFNLKQHREGQKHKAKLKELEENHANGGEKASKPEWCEMCRIPCMNALSLEQHLIGKKHAARLQAIQDAQRAREEDAAATKVKREGMEWRWPFE